MTIDLEKQLEEFTKSGYMFSLQVDKSGVYSFAIALPAWFVPDCYGMELPQTFGSTPSEAVNKMLEKFH